MKMDHHCPWINNCCGHLNHAYFTSFLLLAPLGCSHAAVIFVMTMYTQLYDRVTLWRRRGSPRGFFAAPLTGACLPLFRYRLAGAP